MYRRMNSKCIENQATYFFPTLVQEYVKKQYELRIFYLENRLWATALFTQNDAKTRINQKNYNQNKATRAIPFKLPKIIENKLFLFFKKLNTNTGSVDMIVTPQQEYVFVEVNLNGQFGYYSDVCNYYVEKNIANYLI